MVADEKGQKPVSVGREPTKDAGHGTTPKSSARRKQASGPSGVADSLRVAYQETVSEDVPDEFLSLLAKLA